AVAAHLLTREAHATAAGSGFREDGARARRTGGAQRGAERPLARGTDAFNQALDLMEGKLALYLGRREAARILAGLRI
nr:hypothetical protein [Methyloversatilis sp.]